RARPPSPATNCSAKFRSTTLATEMPRAVWRGSISFGLVTIPVRLYSAVRKRDVRFREVDRLTGRRLHHQRVREIAIPTKAEDEPAAPARSELPELPRGPA